MVAFDNAQQEKDTPFVLYLDTTGKLAYNLGVHTLNCTDPTHMNNTLAFASESASAETCLRCGESTHFTGTLQRCPDCAGNDEGCPVCGGRGAERCIYIVSTPRQDRSDSPMSRADFQAGIEQVWAGVLTQFDTVVDTAQRLAVHLFAQMGAQDDKREILARMAGRACQIADAIGYLLRAGHPDAAFAQTRMLQEIEFNMMAIHDDASSDVGERFREWGFGKMFRNVTNLRQIGIHEVDESEYPKMASEYEVLRNKHGQSFRQDDGWIGRNVFERAKSVNQETDYRKFYTVASSFIHTDSRALLLPIGLSERNSGGILVGPSGVGLDLPAMRTVVSLVHIMIQLPEMLQVNEDEQTNAAFEIIVKSTDGMMQAVEAMDRRNLHATLPAQDE